MADSDLPGLTALTGAGSATGDLVHVVDVSDTTFAADGTDKRMTLAELATGLIAHGAIATDAELAAHTGDTSAAHAASAISFTPAGAVAATDVQAALVEIDGERRRHDFAIKNNANFNTTSATYVDVDSATDLDVAASAGDVLWVGLSVLGGNQAGKFLRIDAATMVSAAAVNYVSGAGASGVGVQAWHHTAQAYANVGGVVPYVVVAGDVSGGRVSLRLQAKVDSAGSPGQDLLCSATTPLHFFVWNVSAPAA